MPPSSPLAAAAVPDTRGWFGDYGGRFAPEVLMGVLEELDRARTETLGDQAFNDEFHSLLKEVAGRPTPLYHARRLTAEVGGADIWLKREGAAFTGSPQNKHTPPSPARTRSTTRSASSCLPAGWASGG